MAQRHVIWKAIAVILEEQGRTSEPLLIEKSDGAFLALAIRLRMNVFIAERNGAGTNRKSIRCPIRSADGGTRTPAIWRRSQRSAASLHCCDARRVRPAAVML